MIRRTFALASAAALALGTVALAGPAAADDTGNAPQTHEVEFSEIGVDLDSVAGAEDPDGEDVDGIFIEMENVTEQPVDLEDYELLGCTPSNTLFSIVTFNSTHDIAAGPGSFFLTADDMYSSSPGGHREDLRLLSALDSLEQSAGGVLLEDNLNNEVDSIAWGTNPPSNCGLNQANDIPTDTASIDRSTSPAWSNTNPVTPESQAGDIK